MRLGGDTDQTVIPKLLGAIGLSCLDYSDEPRVDHAAGECWLVHEQHHVERVAVCGFRTRNKSEAQRKRLAHRKHCAQSEELEAGIETELVAVPLWSFDYHPNR